MTLIEAGMIVGLGSGSTTLFAIRRIGQLYQAGRLKGILGVPPRWPPKGKPGAWAFPSLPWRSIPTSTSPSTAPTKSIRSST